MPSRSTNSPVCLIPAVSHSFTGMPPMEAVSLTRSRVVPGVSVTMARLHRDAADGGGLAHQIARGAGRFRHDGAVLLQQAVEQAALADIGASHDGQRQPLPHQAAILEAISQLARTL